MAKQSLDRFTRRLRTHPLPRGGTDCVQARLLTSKQSYAAIVSKLQCWMRSVPPAVAGGCAAVRRPINKAAGAGVSRHAPAALFLGWGENCPGRLFQNANHNPPVSCLLRTRIRLQHSLKYFPVLESAPRAPCRLPTHSL